jgi:hypothetical protein
MAAPVIAAIVIAMTRPAIANANAQECQGERSGTRAGAMNVTGSPANQAPTFATIHRPRSVPCAGARSLRQPNGTKDGSAPQLPAPEEPGRHTEVG